MKNTVQMETRQSETGTITFYMYLIYFMLSIMKNHIGFKLNNIRNNKKNRKVTPHPRYASKQKSADLWTFLGSCVLAHKNVVKII